MKAAAIGIVSDMPNVNGLGPRELPITVEALKDELVKDEELSCRNMFGVSLRGMGDCKMETMKNAQ